MKLTFDIPDAKYQRILDAFEKTYPESEDPAIEIEKRVKIFIQNIVMSQEKKDQIKALIIKDLEI